MNNTNFLRSIYGTLTGLLEHGNCPLCSMCQCDPEECDRLLLLELIEAQERTYCLIQDESCHWYLCPSDKKREAEQYFESLREYWEVGWNLPGTSEPKQPTYLKQIDSPHRLVFTNPEIK